MIDCLSEDQIAAFHHDGFLIIEKGFIPDKTLDLLRDRFDRLFQAEYHTGIKPDEVNWVAGRDPEDRTRQLCNGWKADPWIASLVLSQRIGRLAAQLMSYTGTRIWQDNVLWKPPGAKSLGMHQDAAFADCLVPSEMITCWMALDDTQAGAGPIEYARSSHVWPAVPKNRGQFHAPPDWLAPARAALPSGLELDLVPVVVKAGGCSFHHGFTFHGSGPNTATIDRRTLVSHLLPAETRFHPVNVDLNYSRYRRRGDMSMDESFFPITWTREGWRTSWLADLPPLPEWPS